MDTWIDQVEFSHTNLDEPKAVRIEGGFDSFERVDIRESNDDEPVTHIFKIEKETDLFEINIRWAVESDDDSLSDDDLKQLAKNRIRTESSYQASHYLKSMNLPPLQALFEEGMVVEMTPDPESLDDD